MNDLRLTRDFPVTPQRLFEVLTTRAEVVQWWGHDGWTMLSETLDFSRPGPWHADMLSEEGNRFKLSGQVTKVDPPTRIGFTWGWHDADDRRGAESHVTFTIKEAAEGARLIIDHRDLPSAEEAARHTRGWSGPLARLSTYLAHQKRG